MRVLICDDDPSLRALLRIALGLEPDLHVVADAADGHEAPELAGQRRPDVIVLDLGMPRMDGLEALPKLRAAVPDARIVVFSGYQESLLGQQAVELGAVAYVEKGADPSTLANTIRNVGEAAA
jgi:DNA-binding NarL/FixJ family response regulator